MAEWYWMKNGQKHGPVDTVGLKQLARTGQLQPTDTIWREGLPNWVPASQAKGLEFGRSQPQPGAERNPAGDSAGSVPNAPLTQGIAPARTDEPSPFQSLDNPFGDDPFGGRETDDATKPCPYCAETVLRAAVKCKHCGEFLDAGNVQRNATPHTHTPTATPTGDGVIVFSGDYSVAYQAMRETLSLLGGTIKVDEQANGKLEAAWRYGLNAFGLRVAVFFRSRDDQSIEITCRGYFKDAMDTFGGARKKRDAVVQEFTRRFTDGKSSISNGHVNTPRITPPPMRHAAPPVTSTPVPHNGFRWYHGLLIAGLLILCLGYLGSSSDDDSSDYDHSDSTELKDSTSNTDEWTAPGFDEWYRREGKYQGWSSKEAARKVYNRCYLVDNSDE